MTADTYSAMSDPRKPIIALTILLIIAVAAFAIITWPKSRILVYTYDSFMIWGDDPEEVENAILEPFEQQYGVDVEIVRLQTDANGIVARMVAEADNPAADVVIGIDNILILQEQARLVLEPYTPSNMTMIDPQLITALDSEHYVIPFDFGIVTLIYSMADINETTYPQLSHLTFQDLSASDMASMLVTENPHLSSPGLAFLLSEIAVHQEILHTDWTQWWSDTKDYVDVQEGWSEAWTMWDTDPTRHILVSYGTDPSYSAYYTGAAPQTAVAPIVYNDTEYAWLQVEGIGLVKNGPNPEIGKALIDYFISAAVQQYIPFNQWMFPASSDVILDSVFEYSLHPEDISPLNLLLPANEIADNLTLWLDEWDLIMSA